MHMLIQVERKKRIKYISSINIKKCQFSKTITIKNHHTETSEYLGRNSVVHD